MMIDDPLYEGKFLIKHLQFLLPYVKAIYSHFYDGIFTGGL